VTDCAALHDLFAAVLEHEAARDDEARVRSHIADCRECAELFEALKIVIGAGDVLAGLDPPRHIAEEISSSPCRRWLGLLYQAVDREISHTNLDGLLDHLESCPSCRQVWHDLTLIHQVGEAMQPPNHLLAKCLRVREAVAKITVLPRRTATAAAYILALLASVAIGNPAIIAQDLQQVAAQRVAEAANGVTEVAAEGRGEVRVALWRAMRGGEQKIDAIRGWVDRLRDDDNDTGAAEADPATDTQGDPQ